MFKRSRKAADFAEEIKAHLELEVDEWMREGLSEEEARRRARVEFGNVHTAQERFNLRNRFVSSLPFVSSLRLPALPSQPC
jgi:macrolide transport system ATP-binding/permease protein